MMTNPSLHEENARTWTAGIDFAPNNAPGLALSSTYYKIKYEDQIYRYPPGSTLNELLADQTWAPLVTRTPSHSQIEKICKSPVFLGSSEDCLASSPVAILDLRALNLSATDVQGIDAEVKQVIRTNHGSFDFGLIGSYMLRFEQAVTRTAPAVDRVGTALNPPTLRLRGTAEWYRNGRNQPGWSASIATDYLGGSRDYDHPPVTHTNALITVDLQLNYRTEQSEAWLGDIELTLNAVNILNQDPPFVNLEAGYDPTNTRPYGRVISFTLQKDW